MNNIFVRILLIAFALFGLYKMFPQVSHFVDYYVKNPSFQNSVVIPAVKLADSVLPDKLKIPTPEVMGVSTDSSESSPLKQVTDQVTQSAANIANDQINQIKKAAGDQFCTILLEKIKSECGSK